jgi:hypothetical protein
MNHFKVSVLAVLIMLFPASVSFASDEWSQFRGPNGSGVSATTGLPQEFRSKQKRGLEN